MAEKQGVKSVGLSWIWKEKYDEKEVQESNRRRGSAATDEKSVHSTTKKGKKFFGHKGKT
jgi:hypothetical protein